MKEKFIVRLLGVDIIAREPYDYPLELTGEPLDKQLTRAADFLNKLIDKEYTVPTEEEIIKDLLN